jgi:MFS family permease
MPPSAAPRGRYSPPTAIGPMTDKRSTDATGTSALRNRNFLVFMAGHTVSLHGLWMYRVTLGWYAWELSHSELWVGIVAATQFAPAVVFGPIFGVLADRFDRRAASMLINSVSVLNMLVLGLLTSLGFMDIRVLTLLSLMQGILDGAHAPVRMSVVPNLVPRAQLQNAIALGSVAFNLSRFVGPAIAGFVIAVFGVAPAFVINGLSYLAFIAAMAVVRLNPSSNSAAGRKHPWQELLDGARYVARHEIILGLLVVAAMVSVFCRGALEMLPAFADEVYRGGATALAILTSAIGGGAVLVGLLMARGTSWLRIGVIHLALLLAGCLVILLGLLDSFPLAVVTVTLLGVTLSGTGIGSQILLQTMVDDEVRGRVSSFWSMIAFGGTSLGALLIGSAAHAFGLQPAVVTTGGLCVAVTLLTALRRRRAESRTRS